MTARRGVKQKQAQNLSTIERAEIFQLWLQDLSASEICRRKNISRYTLARLIKAEDWESRKVFMERALAPEDKAEADRLKKNTKLMLLKVLNDMFDMWNQNKTALVPRSLSDIPNAMAKLVDAISKITDDGDPEALKSIVEIIITDGTQKLAVTQSSDEEDVIESETVPQLEGAQPEVDAQDISEPEAGGSVPAPGEIPDGGGGAPDRQD